MGTNTALSCTPTSQRFDLPSRFRLKSEAVAAVIAFVARLETQSGIRVKVIRSDLGTEFSLKSYCDRMGIIHQTTPGYTPELNGVAERAVGIIKGQTRALNLSTPLGHAYWNYAMRYAVVIQNKITPSGIEGKTAWEVITGRSSNLDSIREYGEVCFAHTPPEIRPRSTLDLPTARQARIIGIDEAVSGYIVRFEDDGSIGRSRDVRSATGLPLDTPLKVPALTPSRQPVRSAPPRVVPVATATGSHAATGRTASSGRPSGDRGGYIGSRQCLSNRA